MCIIHKGIRRIRHTGNLIADGVLCIAIILITIDKTTKSIFFFIRKEILDTCRITVRLCRAPRIERQCRFINSQSTTAADIIVSRYIFPIIHNMCIGSVCCQVIFTGITSIAGTFVILVLFTDCHGNRANRISISQSFCFSSICRFYISCSTIFYTIFRPISDSTILVNGHFSLSDFNAAIIGCYIITM